MQKKQIVALRNQASNFKNLKISPKSLKTKKFTLKLDPEQSLKSPKSIF